MRWSRAVCMCVALLVIVSGAMISGPGAQAAGAGVTAYIELSSTKPNPGCDLNVAVEVRSSGAAISGVTTSIALFAGSDIVAIDDENTDDSGVAHFSVSTTGIGSDGWLDINVGGGYLTGYAIVGTAGNSCDAGSKYDVIESSLSVASRNASAANLPSFPTHQQERNLSCEYAAIQIATSYWGNTVSEWDFGATVPLAANPHYGYRGNIDGAWGNTDDYGVYPEALAAALPGFGYHGTTFYGQGDTSTLTSYLDQGVPVLIWVALRGDQSEVLTDDDTYTVTAGMHVMVAYGYDSSGIYISDPGSGSLFEYSWDTFQDVWSVLDGMALAVTPA
jgi:uncharacterized protein YvpB